MSHTSRFVILLLVFSGAVAPSAQTTESVAQRFGWLEGCWAGERGATSFREIWAVGSPDLMLGMGISIEGSKPAEFDYFRIESRGGKPAYIAQPRGVPPTPFEWQPAASSAENALFANPAHDFPKRVGYRRMDGTSLLAFIDGGDAANRIEFPMKRVACPGPR